MPTKFVSCSPCHQIPLLTTHTSGMTGPNGEQVATAMSMSVNDLASRFITWITHQGTDSAESQPTIAQAIRPWESWELDARFFQALSRWTLDNPETSLDRVLDNIRDGLENSKDLLSLIPESPFPARGLVTALAYLLRLGVSIRRAQRDVQEFARDFVRWVGLVNSAFESAEDGEFARRAWRDLRHMRELVDKMCLWAVDRLNDGRWLRIGHGLTIQKEILEYKERISTARALFQDLSAINMARGLDAIIQKLRSLVSNQQSIINEIREVRKTQQKQLDRIMNELELQKQVAERERFFAKTLNVHAIASSTYDGQGKRPCDEDTRIEVLDDIRKWRDNIKRGSPNFLWLTGDPGCGKSAITASFARGCKDEGVLWAQFFINRNNAETTDPRTFFPSIARQLADYSPEVAQAIHLTLVKKQSLTDDISAEQAALLFTHTIRKASELDPDRPVVIVVDGLDETDRKELKRTAEIFSTLFTALESYSNVKVFISSRTENEIQKSFVLPFNDEHVKRVHLDTADPSCIRDVSHYVARNLLDLVKEHDLNWEVWPGEERSRILGERASGLFIWAVTAIKFIREQMELHGQERLDRLLDLLTTEVLHDINALYTLIITITLGHRQDKNDMWELERFRRIIGAIVCLQEPLCLDDLAAILDLRETPSSKPVDIIHFVRRFRTILVVGTDTVDRTTIPRIHKSVYEFITSNHIDTQFRIDPDHAHLELAIQCLAHLRIARWEYIEDLPAPLRYACRFWSSHLSQANIPGPAALCADIRQLPTTSPQAVLSASPFYPANTPISVQCSTFASKLKVESNDTFRTWNAITGLSLSHRFNVLDMTFSPNGKDIVSWSNDFTIRIWDSTNAELRRTLVQHTTSFTAVAISPDGKSVVSGFDDGSVCLWDYSFGTLIWKSQYERSSAVSCIAFSPAGNWILSGCKDQTCKLLDALTGETVGNPWKGHKGNFVDVAFSTNSQRACAIDTTWRCFVWNVGTGQEIAHWRSFGSYTPTSVSFMPNNHDVIAVVGGNITIHSHNQKWSIPGSYHVDCLSFSPDGKEIIFGNRETISVAQIGEDQATARIIRERDIDVSPHARLCAFSPNWDFAYLAMNNVIYVYALHHSDSSLEVVLANERSYVIGTGSTRQLLFNALPGMKARHNPYTSTNNQRLDTTKWYPLTNRYAKLCIVTDEFVVAGHDKNLVSIW